MDKKVNDEFLDGWDPKTKSYGLRYVYNYELKHHSKKKIHPSFVDWHEYQFDVLQRWIDETPLNLRHRQSLIFMVEQLRFSLIGFLKKDMKQRKLKTMNEELFSEETCEI